MIKAVIFDFFGVVITDSLQIMCAELAKTYPDKANQVGELVQASIRGLIMPEESNKKIAGIFGLGMEEYRSQVANGETRDEQLLEYIVELRQNYKTALLSNVSNGGLLRRFAVEELDVYFDATVASAEIGFAKPEPQAYEIVADKLGVRLDECVFTDDREDYCEGAQAVGMQTIQYVSFSQFKTKLSEILQSQ